MLYQLKGASERLVRSGPQLRTEKIVFFRVSMRFFRCQSLRSLDRRKLEKKS